MSFLSFEKSDNLPHFQSHSKWGAFDYLSNKFIFRNDSTSFRLINSEMKLALPQPRTDYVRKSFSYSGAALWNSHLSRPPPGHLTLNKLSLSL